MAELTPKGVQSEKETKGSREDVKVYCIVNMAVDNPIPPNPRKRHAPKQIGNFGHHVRRNRKSNRST